MSGLLRGLALVVLLTSTAGCSSAEFNLAAAREDDATADTVAVETARDDGGDDSTIVDTGEIVDTGSSKDSAISMLDVTVVDTRVVDAPSDEITIDTALADTLVDSGASDSGVFDSGAFDSGAFDSGASDSGVFDSGVFDSGTADTLVDSGASDSGVFDSGAFDSGTTDTSVGGCDKTSECATNFFCYKTGCTTRGNCQPLPSGISNYAPVCGCDGVTYWNSFQAATYSVGVASNGRCVGDSRQTCVLSGACPAHSGSECIFELSEPSDCSSLTPVGTCWRNPSGKICPPTASGPTVGSCVTSACVSHCEAVKAKIKFYTAALPCTTM